jgi:hypothetical protein
MAALTNIGGRNKLAIIHGELFCFFSIEMHERNIMKQLN